MCDNSAIHSLGYLLLRTTLQVQYRQLSDGYFFTSCYPQHYLLIIGTHCLSLLLFLKAYHVISYHFSPCPALLCPALSQPPTLLPRPAIPCPTLPCPTLPLQGDCVVEGELREMYVQWPFFREMIDLIAMTLSKTDYSISTNYEKQVCAVPYRNVV